MIHIRVAPLSTTAASTAACKPRDVWTARTARRLSNRSATTPPQAPNTRTGKNWAAVTNPTWVPLPVILSTNQASATVWAHVPHVDAI